MNSTALIIDRPHLVPHHKRLIYGVTTLAIWSFWLFLWLPLATFFGWVIGGLLGYHQMVVLEGYRDLIHLMVWYALVVLIMGGGLCLWATYNLLRFRGKERRSALPDAGTEAYANHFGVAPDDLTAWRKSKVLSIHHNVRGHIHSVVVAPTPKPV